MPTRSKSVAALFIGALSIACETGRTHIATAPSPTPLIDDAGLATRSAGAPILSRQAAPVQPGNSGIFRFTDGSGFFIYDLDRGLLSLHGSATLFTDICAGSTPPIFELVNIQTIETASGLHWMFKDKEHPVQIYPAVPFGCPSLAVTPRLAAGSARITRVDNDLFGDSRAMNAFGWQASGLLEDLVNGGTIRYNEVVRALYNPEQAYSLS